MKNWLNSFIYSFTPAEDLFFAPLIPVLKELRSSEEHVSNPTEKHNTADTTIKMDWAHGGASWSWDVWNAGMAGNIAPRARWKFLSPNNLQLTRIPELQVEFPGSWFWRQTWNYNILELANSYQKRSDLDITSSQIRTWRDWNSAPRIHQFPFWDCH